MPSRPATLLIGAAALAAVVGVVFGEMSRVRHARGAAPHGERVPASVPPAGPAAAASGVATSTGPAASSPAAPAIGIAPIEPHPLGPLGSRLASTLKSGAAPDRLPPVPLAPIAAPPPPPLPPPPPSVIDAGPPADVVDAGPAASAAPAPTPVLAPAGGTVVVRLEDGLADLLLLIEADVYLDGRRVKRVGNEKGVKAAAGIELYRGPSTAGQHQVRLELLYGGKPGLFSYMEGYRFRVREMAVVALGAGEILIVTGAAFDKGAMLEFERRPDLRLTAATSPSASPSARPP